MGKGGKWGKVGSTEDVSNQVLIRRPGPGFQLQKAGRGIAHQAPWPVRSTNQLQRMALATETEKDRERTSLLTPMLSCFRASMLPYYHTTVPYYHTTILPYYDAAR